MSRQFYRDVLGPWIAALLLGLGLGAVFAAAAGGSSFSPSHVYWPFTTVAIAAGLIASAAWGYLVIAESAFQKSDALDIAFNPDDAECVYEFGASAIAVAEVPITGTYLPYVAHRAQTVLWSTGVRVHVMNLRSRRLRHVTVHMMDARKQDGTSAYRYPDVLLKWMHDDTGAQLHSLEGRQIEPGNDVSAYMDLATKSHAQRFFALETVQKHLRRIPVAAEPTYVHLQAMGEDAQTGKSVPSCHRAFLIDIREDGGLSVTPKTLEQCGFTR